MPSPQVSSAAVHVQDAANQIVNRKPEIISVGNQLASHAGITSNEALYTLAGVVITALLVFAGKWWTGLFGYQSAMVQGAKDAFEIQNKAIEELRQQIAANKAQFDQALEESQASLKQEISVLEEENRKYRKEVYEFRIKVAAYERQEQIYMGQLKEWKAQYVQLNAHAEKLEARLEVYEKVSKGS